MYGVGHDDMAFVLVDAQDAGGEGRLSRKSARIVRDRRCFRILSTIR